MGILDIHSKDSRAMETLQCGCGTMDTSKSAEKVDRRKDCGRRRGVFLMGSIACYRWWAVLLTLLGTIAQTHQATSTTTLSSTTTIEALTPIQGCFLAFEAEDITAEFKDPCQKITFTTGRCTNLTSLQKTNPNDCTRYFVCADRLVYDCPTSPGTGISASSGFVDIFYANCTCPDGRGADTTRRGGGGEEEKSNVGLIVGIVVALIVLIAVIVIVIIIRRKKQQQAKPMMPTIGQQSSTRSEYEDVTDLKRGDDRNIYDNPPSYDTAVYDNHGFGDRDAIRPREKNATITSTVSEVPSQDVDAIPEATAPPLPTGHPVSQKDKTPEDEPVYMETV